jgi:hypothetical protein
MTWLSLYRTLSSQNIGLMILFHNGSTLMDYVLSREIQQKSIESSICFGTMKRRGKEIG